MTKINLLAWINTKWYLKLIRVALGIATYFLVYYTVSSIRDTDAFDPGDVLFEIMLPKAITSFLVCGPLVLLCSRIGLVSENKLTKED